MKNGQVEVTLKCFDPDGEGSGCGRQMTLPGVDCTFCTKFHGGCGLQRMVTVTVTDTND